MKSSILQPLVQKQKSVTLPEQTLYAVRASAAEKEQCSLVKWIQMKVFGNYTCETVYSVSEVSVTAGQVNTAASVRIQIIKHVRSPPAVQSAA